MVVQKRLFCLTLILAVPVELYGQLNRSSIEGIVVDPQGSVVVNAQVSAVAQSTNVTSKATTNQAGYYRLIDLVPDKYTIRIEALGFAVSESRDVELIAGQSTRFDTTLRIGSAQQRVEVTSATPLLQTEASNFSTAVEQKTIDDTPLQGRDLQQLVYLLPGVTNVAGPPGSNFGFNSQYGTFPDPTYTQGSDLSVNGGQGGANAWYLDGNINLSDLAENIAVNPSPDAVSEFQAVTNGFAAQYGRTGGGVFNVVLKSGTNQPHGDLYEYFRNSATNARNPFTSVDSKGDLIKDRVLHYNDFGGTLGGPVVIPKLYNGKDRTFFFFSFDHTLLHLSGQQVFSVPTQAMRNGNFSEDPNTSLYGIYNPYSSAGPTASGTFQRTAFGTPLVSNGCLNTVIEASSSPTCKFATQIPTNMMDPVAMFFLKSYPLPNYIDPLSNCPMGKNGYAICDNYLGPIGSSQDPYNISIKVDHQLGEKNRFFAEYLYNPGRYNIYQLPWTGPTAPYVGYGGDIPFDFSNQLAGIGYTLIASPTFINEFRASFSRETINAHPNQAGFPNSVTDLSQVQQVLAPSKIYLGAFTPTPTFQVSMPSIGGQSIFGPPGWVNQYVGMDAYTIVDDVTKIVDRHTIKFGFVSRLDQEGRDISDPTFLTFNGVLTQDPNTGLGGGGLEQMMMGAIGGPGGPQANSSTGITAQAYASFRYWGFYVQDDYRVTPRLTLNIGLRYDINGFWKSRYGPESNFCLTCFNSQTGMAGEMVYEGSPQIPNGSPIEPAHLGDIAPRFNFSWSPFGDDKTVVRGGYDIFYTNASNSFNNIGQGIIPGAEWQSYNFWNGSFDPNVCSQLSEQCVAFKLSDTTTNKANLTVPPIPANGLPPAADRVPAYGTSFMQIYAPVAHDPMEQSWGLDIQRELPGNMMFDIGYVGTHGTHLAGSSFTNFNFVPTAEKIQYKTQLNANVPISNYFSGSQAALLAQAWGSTSLPLSYFLQPYPFFGSLTSQTVYDGTSIYDALNTKLQKRFSHGFNLLVHYTFSKKIYNAATAQLASLIYDPVHIASARPNGIGGLIGASGGLNGLAYQDPDNRDEDRSIAYDDIPHIFNAVWTYELPFGSGKTFLNKHGLLNGVFGGWRIVGNFTAESGVPLQITGPCNQLTCRPDLVGNPTAVPGGQNASHWINAAAFEPVFGNDPSFWANPNPNAPQEWVFGTAGAYLPFLRSPGFWNVDSSLIKDFHLSERRYVEVRWEVYNTLNHMNLGFPNTNYCLPPGPNGQTNLVQQAGCSFGEITNIQTDPRAQEFALKFYF